MNDLHFQTNREENGLVWFSAPRLNADGGAVHGFSSRLGGVSPWLSDLPEPGHQPEATRWSTSGRIGGAAGKQWALTAPRPSSPSRCTGTTFAWLPKRTAARSVPGAGLRQRRRPGHQLSRHPPGHLLRRLHPRPVPRPGEPGGRRLSRWLAGHCRGHRGEDGAGDDPAVRLPDGEHPHGHRPRASPAAASRPTTTCPTPCGRFWASRPTPLSTGCPGRSFSGPEGHQRPVGSAGGRACQPN